MLNIKFYTKEIIEQILPGYWYIEPADDWSVETVVINDGQLKIEKDSKTLFIAIDTETWHKGSGNKGIYKGWKDTHSIVEKFTGMINGLIVQRPIEHIDQSIPQYVTDNTYNSIKLLGDYVYSRFEGKTIAVTGTAGKSTTKNLLNTVLSNVNDTVVTRGNHNTRTGVPLTISCAVNQPAYLVLETAISSLWMRSGGIMKRYPADIAMITSIDGGQQKTAHETAVLKAKVAEGMGEDGVAVLNRDMNEFETVYKEIKNYTQNIITYGFHEAADNQIIEVIDRKFSTHVKVLVNGEKVAFDTHLNSHAMIQNIVGVLTVVSQLNIPLEKVIPSINEYRLSKGIQSFEETKLKRGGTFTILDDSWNATGVSMLESIKLFAQKSKYYSGRKIAVLGRIVNLDKEEAKRQHQALAAPLIESGIDLVFTYGEEMKHLMRKLPEQMIGGYFEDANQLTGSVANIIRDDDFVLIKGSRRGNQFATVKTQLVQKVNQTKPSNKIRTSHPYSSEAGAATYEVETLKKVGQSGNQDVQQNQGLGGVMLINYVLDQIFSKQLDFLDVFKPGRQALKENKAPKSLKLEKDKEINLHDLLNAATLNHSPNALLMLANQVIGSNKKAVNIIKETASAHLVTPDAALNITGRRISNKKQKITLDDLSKIGSVLFKKAPFILEHLSMRTFTFNKQKFSVMSNLYTYGYITHGLFFGYLDSLGIVLSQRNNKKYLTVTAGCRNPFERDNLIIESLESMDNGLQKNKQNNISKKTSKSDYTINLIGDTYAGEFYTDIRKRQKRKDALQTEGRNYSFNEIRPLFSSGDLNIVNFEAAISNNKNDYLRLRKPFVLYSEPEKTGEYLKQENVHLATLANNHLLDCGLEGLKSTLKELEDSGIDTIGAGVNQEKAEKPYIIEAGDKRIGIFNAYWYRNPMYREFDFYAVGQEAGVACMSGNIVRNIKQEKELYPDGKIIVVAHWGVDFKTVHQKQREYAHMLVEAGADLIIGHGAHMVQEIDEIESVPVVYSIGNGVFNSDGEYNRRFVPPYSLMAQINIHKDVNELRLYPIYCNNKKTFWQSHFVNEKEFHHCSLMLQSYGSGKLKNEKNSHYYYSFEF